MDQESSSNRPDEISEVGSADSAHLRLSMYEFITHASDEEIFAIAAIVKAVGAIADHDPTQSSRRLGNLASMTVLSEIQGNAHSDLSAKETDQYSSASRDTCFNYLVNLGIPKLHLARGLQVSRPTIDTYIERGTSYVSRKDSIVALNISSIITTHLKDDLQQTDADIKDFLMHTDVSSFDGINEKAVTKKIIDVIGDPLYLRKIMQKIAETFAEQPLSD